MSHAPPPNCDVERARLGQLFRDAKLGQPLPSDAEWQRMQLRLRSAASARTVPALGSHSLRDGSSWATGRVVPLLGGALAAAALSLSLLGRGSTATTAHSPPSDSSAAAIAALEKAAPSLPGSVVTGSVVPGSALPGAAALGYSVGSSRTLEPPPPLPHAVATRAGSARAGDPQATRVSVSAVASKAEDDPLLRGLRALEAAELALRQGRLADARSQLASPVPPALTLHRSALEAMVACAAGARSTGRGLTAEHAAAYPASPYLVRMRASCASE